MTAQSKFSREKRIRTAQGFRNAYTEGRKAYSPLFVLFCRETGDDKTRLGVTVSRRIGNAVERARCKRLLREAFRLHQQELSQGLDFVFNARRALVDSTLHEVTTEFIRCVSRSRQ